jgi:Ca2+-binding EF-hand superfamily protein
MMDNNGDGKLSKNEFERSMQIMEIKVTSTEIDDLFLFIDLDG